ncbi:MAG: OB-fold domain-containing protein [Acidimicrobiia bacterium]|nr:OB-fold domain-containing protein [Acidimicrobiia bacterium]
MSETSVTNQVPLVDYLVLGDPPHLVANECVDCGARYFDRRNACASCGGTNGFRRVDVPTEGELRAFTIVSMAAPGIPVPFVAGVIDCGGTSVRGNIVNVEPDPEHVTLGMKVRLTTFPIGVDSNGTEAIGFGFEPQEVR